MNITLAGLSLCMLLSSLGTSIAHVALPSLALSFAASFQEVQWVVLAYLLATTSLIVSVGRLGDITGRRRLLLAGIVLFTVASLLCGLAPRLWLLVAARGLQGLGAATLMALSLAFVADAVPEDKIGRATGLLATTSAVGTALGPSLGGALLAGFGWRGLFLIQVPLGLVALFLARRTLPVDAAQTEPPSFDTVGTLLLALTLAAYSLALTTANLVQLLAAVCGLGLFTLSQRSTATALIPWAGLVMSMLVTTVVMTTLVVGPFYLSGGLGLEAAHVGLVLSCGPLLAALTGVPAGRLVDRFGANRIGLAGLIAMALGSALLAVMPMNVAGYLAPLAVLTVGYGLFQAANHTAIMRDVGEDRRGVVAGLLHLARNLGLITGASLMGTVYSLAGPRVTFTLASALIVVALAIGYATFRRRPDPGSDLAALTS